MSIEDALRVGAQRAYSAAKEMDVGHRPSALGQMRHFHMNESFQLALLANGARPSPIRGNNVITGRSGIINLARFNSSLGSWNNSRRSLTRRQMSLANQAIAPLVFGDLFDEYEPPTDITVFFVSTFSGSILLEPELPVSIHIAVPDAMMQGWLFKEDAQVFIQRYEQIPAQVDLVNPTLKTAKKQQNPDSSAS